MGYAPTRTQRTRQERRSSKQQLATEAQQQIEDIHGAHTEVDQEEFDKFFYQDDLLFYDDVTQRDYDLRVEHRQQVLSGTYPDGRPYTSVSLFIAYVDEVIDDLGPLDPEESDQYHKVLASIRANNEAYQVFARA